MIDNKFYSIKVSKIIFETHNSISLFFEIPYALRDKFSYREGQYLTIRRIINGKEIRRSYSISSVPNTEMPISICVKKITNGIMSSYLFKNISMGDSIDCMPPLGNFYSVIDKRKYSNYVFFAGGSGITPIISILKTLLYTQEDSKIYLYYSNRETRSIIFRKDIERLQKKFNNRLQVIHHISRQDTIPNSRNWINKRLNDSYIADYLETNLLNKEHDSVFFICGPTPMINRVRDSLLKNNINKNQISIEYFNNQLDSSYSVKESIKRYNVSILLDDQEFNLALREGETVLESAINAGIDPPYSCKNGVCTTCKALLISGKAKMIENLSLDDDELKEGYVLTCQCIPLEDNIRLSYDMA